MDGVEKLFAGQSAGRSERYVVAELECTQRTDINPFSPKDQLQLVMLLSLGVANGGNGFSPFAAFPNGTLTLQKPNRGFLSVEILPSLRLDQWQTSGLSPPLFS